jgi:AraC-like DNA-binding protein
VLYHNLDLKNEMLELIEISKSEKECTQELIEITNRLFYKMYCHSIKEEPDNLGTQIKKYIAEHITEDFSIDEIEKEFDKSRSQIFRTFKEQYGITPYSHYLNEKLSLSKNLLINTQLSINEIALSLNFYDEYHFSKYFKQKEGVSPLTYRKNNTASISNN